jgi:type II secretory pathway pseudopilin PulG
LPSGTVSPGANGLPDGVIVSPASRAEVTRMGSLRFFTHFRSVVFALRGDGGFTLVESMMAAVLLMMVGTSLSGVLASSVVTYNNSREKTLAQQLAMDQIEAIRRMPFSNVGLPNGNPPGTLQAQRPINVIGLHGKLNLQITYVDDQTPNAYRTYANYKKIVLTVVRNKDNKELAKEVTFLSAAARNAATESVIKAQVRDFVTNGPIANATVNLLTGPSAPRSDATDAGGWAIFPSLIANPSSGSQAYYDLNVAVPFGYTLLKDDLAPASVAHTQLGVAQTWETPLRVYKPCSVDVSLTSAPTEPVSGTAVPYTISIGSGRGAEAFNRSAGTTFFGPVSQLAGEGIVPGPLAVPNSTEYLVGASAVYGGGTKYWFATAVSKAVPIDYAAGNLTQNYQLLGSGTWYTSSNVKALTVKVQTSGGAAIPNARVAVSGGPGTAPGIYVAGVTNSSGLVTINVPSNSSPGYTINAWGPNTRATPLTGQSVTGAVTKTLTAS